MAQREPARQSTLYTTRLCKPPPPVGKPPPLSASRAPPSGGPRPPPLRLLGVDRGQVPRRGARGRDRVLHPEAKRVGVVVRPPPRAGREIAQGKVDRDVAGGVGRGGHVPRPASLCRSAHNIVCHAFGRHKGRVGRLFRGVVACVPRFVAHWCIGPVAHPRGGGGGDPPGLARRVSWRALLP